VEEAVIVFFTFILTQTLVKQVFIVFFGKINSEFGHSGVFIPFSQQRSMQFYRLSLCYAHGFSVFSRDKR